jgi:hypothetical protein
MKIHLLITNFFLLTSIAFSQSTFVHRSGNVDSDYGMTCAPTRDGGAIIGNETHTNGMDLHSGLVKYDASGNMQWYKLYQVGQYTIPYSVLETDEGYMVFAIGTDSALLNYNNHFLVLYKTDNNGVTIWNRQYQISNNDLPLNMVRSVFGGYLAFSMGDYNLGTYPYTSVTKFDDLGNIVRVKQFTAPYGLRGTRGIELPNGNICFTATVGDPAISFMTDVVVATLDHLGNILWVKNFGTYYDDEPNAIATNASNDIFITGRGYYDINRAWDSFLLHLDQNGNLVASKVYDGGSQDGEIMRSIMTMPDGTLRLLGDMGTFNERDIVMINIDSNLSVMAAHRYTFSPLFTNYPYEMFRTQDGGIIFTGDYRPPSAYRDAIVAKTEADGTLPCFTVNQTINEFNETFHDTVLSLTPLTPVITTLNFPDSVPNNPFFDHVVCALSTGVKEPQSKIENVYPNPVIDILNIRFDDEKNVDRIQLMNAEGKMIFDKNIESRINSYLIDMKDYASGIYVLRILSDGPVQLRSIVKK